MPLKNHTQLRSDENKTNILLCFHVHLGRSSNCDSPNNTKLLVFGKHPRTYFHDELFLQAFIFIAAPGLRDSLCGSYILREMDDDVVSNGHCVYISRPDATEDSLNGSL